MKTCCGMDYERNIELSMSLTDQSKFLISTDPFYSSHRLSPKLLCSMYSSWENEGDDKNDLEILYFIFSPRYVKAWLLKLYCTSFSLSVVITYPVYIVRTRIKHLWKCHEKGPRDKGNNAEKLRTEIQTGLSSSN